eukprot:COSAG02_NODE_2304_length_9182_cov_12.195530_6_plen_145_part_00
MLRGLRLGAIRRIPFWRGNAFLMAGSGFYPCKRTQLPTGVGALRVSAARVATAAARLAARAGTTSTESGTQRLAVTLLEHPNTHNPQAAIPWMSIRLGDFPACTDGAHVSLFTPSTVPGRTAEGFDVKRRGKLARRRTFTPFHI